jgi:hypothetical protein
LKTPQPEILDVDLIKVRTINKKVIKALVEPVGTQLATQPDEVDFLGYLPEYDAILARRQDNQRLAVIRAISYYSWAIDQKSGKDYQTSRDAAQAVVAKLPQIFMD